MGRDGEGDGFVVAEVDLLDQVAVEVVALEPLADPARRVGPRAFVEVGPFYRSGPTRGAALKALRAVTQQEDIMEIRFPDFKLEARCLEGLLSPLQNTTAKLFGNIGNDRRSGGNPVEYC